MPFNDSCREHLALSRRQLLAGGATSLALWSLLPRAAIAGTRDPRLLLVILRGGVDGLALAAPVGDPDYARMRAQMALPAKGQGAGVPLDNMFALNSAMPTVASLYKKREALLFHAMASPYRGRSHFDAQDVLESGLPGVAKRDEGWLNRALAGLPAAEKVGPRKGLAMGAVVPLVMRGQAPVLSWMPQAYNTPLRDSTIARLMDLYSQSDPRLAKVFAESQNVERVGGVKKAATPLSATAAAVTPAAAPAAPDGAMSGMGGGMAGAPAPAAKNFKEFVETAEVAARFLAQPDGPRIGALSYNGWDTHANEGALKGALATRLGGLDAAIAAFVAGIGPAWKDTVVIVVSEFGRTVRFNGSLGTDHGTATTALLLGGAVKGGRVIADWPGLSDKALYEGRDLAPTKDLRAMLKGVLRDHVGVPTGALARVVFPESERILPMDGLLA